MKMHRRSLASRSLDAFYAPVPKVEDKAQLLALYHIHARSQVL